MESDLVLLSFFSFFSFFSFSVFLLHFFEKSDPTPPARKILINCTPHDGFNKTISQFKTKSLIIHLLEKVPVRSDLHIYIFNDSSQ